MRLTWAQPEDLVPHELVQSRAEGRDVEAIADEWSAAGGATTPPRGGASPERAPEQLRVLARVLLDRLDALPGARVSPQSWEGVLELLPAPVQLAPPGADLDDRIHGAWLGRSAACLLGKPVEKIPREGIEALLRSTGRWPLTDYFTANGLDPEVARVWPWNKASGPTSLVENIDGMPEDDDLNYPILNLELLETRGRDFTTDDVAQLWLTNLPAGRVFTAERIAYRNLLDGNDPVACAQIRNPFREWIGALIRGDVFGWVNPGDVREAARMAWVDARLSHTGNGVWGELWSAALTSAALVSQTVDEVLDASLSVVPADSDLARAVVRGVAIGRAGLPLEEELDQLHRDFGGLHWVHTVNNAAVIAYALAKSGGDFDIAAPAAVLPGWDTDSAGATVGSVIGALRGRAGIADRWTAPLRNRIATSLPGMNGVAIDALAARTSALVPHGVRS
ncbi:ADP-ribosylglycohydrolase family protein [Leifsonia shinshuensis]|uniref:ADP-ribosylglycohydrolase family protein n=1 Tax=Leifsonia shinshuensis TaxID=150026 RepID=UPI001F51323F|nr:ADP-ribosylglycohydrolase family protein [Leifsonia shinshuensis]MCI0157094.1 ADP-ribosylglycohydrolase family protein [Leifsonia shinshuensis]